MDPKKFKVKRLIEELESKRGRHTELITVYIPAGYPIVEVTNQLLNEVGTAANIKSKTTRKNVVTSLEKTVQQLRLYRKTPDNGLAVFCGNVAESEGQQDFQIWVIEPPNPIKIRLYRCDQVFVLDPLKDQLIERETYGLLVMDRREANIALLVGKNIRHMKKLTSFVPGKFKAGGQSAQRLARVIEGLAHAFLKEVGEAANEVLKDENVMGILIGGPGPTKNHFVDGDFMSIAVKKKILGIVDIGDTSESGLSELVEKGKEYITETEVVKEKNLIRSFFTKIATNSPLVLYGPKVKEAVAKGAVDVLLLSEGIDIKIVDELEPIATNFGTSVELVSQSTQEGEQFYAIGGLGAFLRFAV